MDFNQLEDDAVEESKSPTNIRRKNKAFTQQIDTRKSSLLLEYEGFDEEVFQNQLIKSTKRRYSFDESAMTSSSVFFEKLEPEEKKTSFFDIKRNDVKKKKFVVSDNPTKMNEDVPVVQKIMSTETANMIKNTLCCHFLFSNMDMIQMY